jgi:hypothetical protein
MSADGFDERLEARGQEILALLSRPLWRPWNGAPRDPELRKNLDRLHTAITDARRLRQKGDLAGPDADRALELLDVEARALGSDALGQLLEAVDQLLVSTGDELLVCALLEAEYARDRLERGGAIPTWSTLYEAKPIAASNEFAAGQPVTEAALDEARAKLSALLRVRHSLYALSRARTTARAARLLRLAPLVTALVVAVIVLVDLVADDVSWRRGLLVALAGALGASVAGAYKLRDQLPRLSDMRIFFSVFALQPPLGAAAGLFLWIVLLSGLVEVADVGADWAAEAAVAFAAGFSEPLLLKTVERIAGGPKQKDDDTES